MIKLIRKSVNCAIVAFMVFFCLCAVVNATPTTEVHVIKYSPDGETIVDEKTVGYEWMKENLPVMGDGKTHYYHQGPVFEDDKEKQWDVNETTNFKDHGAVMGTDIKDLCDLVGGASLGDDIMIRACDGYHTEFDYKNVYEPSPFQGPMVLCWYNGEDPERGERQGVGYPPDDYYMGMRLTFFADNSTNADGLHVFGNNDMRNSFPPERLYLYNNLYPSTNGYTIKWVDEIGIYTGGYNGSASAPAKSLQGDGAKTQPSPTTAPLSTALVLVAVCAGMLGTVLAGRRS